MLHTVDVYLLGLIINHIKDAILADSEAATFFI